MRWLLPKSLNGFLLLGLSVLAGPLLFAILNATVQMRRLADNSQRLVVDSVQTTRLSQDLYAQIALLERSARLYEVLGDPTVLAAFREHDQRFSAIVVALIGQLRAPDAQARLARLIDQEAQIRSLVLNTKSPAGEPTALASAFVALGDLTASGASLSNQQIDSDVAALQSQTDKARRELFLESSLLLPLVLIAVLLFALRLSRPLRQIDRAIGELGRGNFSHDITVSGPVDLERLGHQLEWLRNRLLELAQERNRFLRHMSHEPTPDAGEPIPERIYSQVLRSRRRRSDRPRTAAGLPAVPERSVAPESARRPVPPPESHLRHSRGMRNTAADAAAPGNRSPYLLPARPERA